MDINITILIQIANFFIAYVIVRTLLLKPVVTVILEEEKHREELNENLQNILDANNAKRETMTREWTANQKLFEEQVPLITSEEAGIEQSNTSDIKEATVSDAKNIEPITELVADELEERLSHVR